MLLHPHLQNSYQSKLIYSANTRGRYSSRRCPAGKSDSQTRAKCRTSTTLRPGSRSGTRPPASRRSRSHRFRARTGTSRAAPVEPQRPLLPVQASLVRSERAISWPSTRAVDDPARGNRCVVEEHRSSHFTLAMTHRFLCFMLFAYHRFPMRFQLCLSRLQFDRVMLTRRTRSLDHRLRPARSSRRTSSTCNLSRLNSAMPNSLRSPRRRVTVRARRKEATWGGSGRV